MLATGSHGAEVSENRRLLAELTSNLKPNQVFAIEEKLAGSSDVVIANAVGVSVTTVRRWKKTDETFGSAYALVDKILAEERSATIALSTEQRKALTAEAFDELTRNLKTIINRVVYICKHGSDRDAISGAKEVFRVLGLGPETLEPTGKHGHVIMNIMSVLAPQVAYAAKRTGLEEYFDEIVDGQVKEISDGSDSNDME